MDRPRPNLTAHLGYWSAATGSLLAFGSTAVVYLLNERWTSLADYVANYRDIQLMPILFWLALAPLVVIAMGCLHALAEGPKKALSRLAFGFSLPYATIVGGSYFLQLTYVRQRILGNDLVGLEQWIVTNPGSVLSPLDLLGYFFLGLSTLFAAPLFSGSRLESSLRGILVVHAVMGIGGLVAALLSPSTSADAQEIGFLLLVTWGVVFGTAMALLAAMFRYLAGILAPVQEAESDVPVVQGPRPFSTPPPFSASPPGVANGPGGETIRRSR